MHILNTARALRFKAQLPVKFWGYCALDAGYLINRTPTKLLNGRTPFELVYKRPPPMSHLRVFGCLCYVHNQKHGGDKFEERGTRSVSVGYPFNNKGWRVYNLDISKVSVSRDVVFNESEYPFSTPVLSIPIIPSTTNEASTSLPPSSQNPFKLKQTLNHFQLRQLQNLFKLRE
ncbi:hypothetical protein YC2023_061175 [Brassica napus]